jgi:G3E family GTPase
MNEWPELYKDQVANAQIVVFSKCESTMPEILSQTKEAIRSINPDAEIICEHYSLHSDDWWRSIMDLPAKDMEITSTEESEVSISQITMNHARLHNATELVMMLEDCLRGQFGHIARAKGTIPVGSETLRFDLADGLYSITDSPDDTNQCVFIGESLDKSGICRRMGSSLEAESFSFAKPSLTKKALRLSRASE